MDVPIIDLRTRGAGAKLARTLHRSSFVVLVGHAIPPSLVEDVFAEWAAFFDSAVRDRYLFTPDGQDGYFPAPLDEQTARETGRDRKEFFHLYPWGQVPSEVSDAALRYRRLAMAMGKTLLGWIDNHTPVEAARRFPIPLPRMLDGGEGNTLLRIIRYPPSPDAGLRSGAHRDTNLLTLLPAATGVGLQVRVPDGTWSDVPCEAGTIAVNGGVMLEMLSGGHYPSALHRVVVPEGSAAARPRMAMPLFLHPAHDVVLDGERTAADFLRDRARQPSERASGASSA
jgi:isopenicillin N synthase-like dioxygenase